MLELDTSLWPLEKTIGDTAISLRYGDLTLLEVDAIVHYARGDLALRAGFGRLIRARGGRVVEEELEAAGSVEMGKAISTSGGNLRCRHIIHVCGPKFQEPEFEGKYHQAIYSAVFLADAIGARTVAFPAMGAGFYGVPLTECAGWMVSSLKTALAAGTRLERVILCAMDRREFEAFRKGFASF